MRTSRSGVAPSESLQKESSLLLGSIKGLAIFFQDVQGKRKTSLESVAKTVLRPHHTDGHLALS